MFGKVVDNTCSVLENGRYLAVVIGDKYSDGEWIPLGFYTMQEVMKRGYKLKSTIVKNFDTTKGKMNQKELWRYRALLADFTSLNMNTSSYLRKKKESKMFKPTEKNQMKIFVAFLILCIIIIFAALVISCSTKEAGINVDLRLHDIWALESINGEEFVKDEPDNNHPVIEIYLKEERIHGNAGCNTINGKVEVDGNNIAFSNIITTEMACPGDIEQRFLSAIQSVDGYKIEKLRLFLYEGEKERLVFRKID